MLILTGSVMNTYAQWFKKNKKPEPDYGFHLLTSDKSIHLDFKVFSNLIVVPVVIDDLDTLQFILDTGVSSIIITDPALKEKLNLKHVREVQISGAGEEKPITASVSVGHKFQMGDFVGYQQNMVILNEDILQLSEFIGTPIHGIFGHCLFENYVVSIDFTAFVLSIYKPDKFKFRKRYGDKYPIVVTEGKPYTDAMKITASNFKETNVRLVIDTGAGHALLLNSDDTTITLPEKVIRANLGRGLNGELYGNIGRVDKIKMGKYEMKDVLATFPDSLSFSMKFPPSDANRQGSIGGELLRRFRVTLNYPEGYMALKANKKRFNQPFEHDMSGMDVRAYSGNYHRFYVKYISENSPAEEAGLMADDEIVFINNRNTNSMTISDIYKILSKKEGKTVDIFYRRDGRLGFTSMVLRRSI